MKCKKLGWLKPCFLLATQSTKKQHKFETIQQMTKWTLEHGINETLKLGCRLKWKLCKNFKHSKCLNGVQHLSRNETRYLGAS
jgi:hypothetical protein